MEQLLRKSIPYQPLAYSGTLRATGKVAKADFPFLISDKPRRIV